MKKNKILIPALAILALGVAGATTGTVAWYQSANVPTVSSALYNGSAIGTSATVIPLGDVEIEFTISAISGVQLTDLVDVSGTDTLYKGMVSGSVDAQGNVTNGAVSTSAVTADEKASFLKQYEVTAAYKTATDQQKAALAGHSVEVTLTASGLAKLRADDGLTGDDDASHTLTVSFVAGGTINVTGEKYVRIQAKETGASKVDLESDHSGDKLSIAALNQQAVI